MVDKRADLKDLQWRWEIRLEIEEVESAAFAADHQISGLMLRLVGPRHPTPAAERRRMLDAAKSFEERRIKKVGQ